MAITCERMGPISLWVRGETLIRGLLPLAPPPLVVQAVKKPFFYRLGAVYARPRWHLKRISSAPKSLSFGWGS